MGIDGSHLSGEEYMIMDVAGNYSNSADGIRCVFATGEMHVYRPSVMWSVLRVL
ncbi:MAG TPA: hypothetical protein VN372_11380 [Methanospirillum sp.]|nr:hypothetical protein [Methanospirillum sp.]